MKKLVLFDIDGTIMNTDGGGAISCQGALQQVFGREVPLNDYKMSGKTDTQIVLELMARVGIGHDETMARLDEIQALYIDALSEEVQGWHPEVCPGIPDLLIRLSQMPDILLGLLTGNIQRGAEVKLNRVGLWSYFKTGAFGDRAPERRLLPEAAQQAAIELTGRTFAEKEIVVIGDTPNDILCGRHLNVRTIAVATGSYEADELKKHGPDYLFDDLLDTDAVVAAIVE